MSERCGECGEAVNSGFRVCPSCGAHRGSRIKAIIYAGLFFFIGACALSLGSVFGMGWLYLVSAAFGLLGLFGLWMAWTGYWEKSDG